MKKMINLNKRLFIDRKANKDKIPLEEFLSLFVNKSSMIRLICSQDIDEKNNILDFDPPKTVEALLEEYKNRKWYVERIDSTRYSHNVANLVLIINKF